MSNQVDPNIYYIIGMSPGNSYFKDTEVTYLLKTLVEKYGRVGILIADVPAISTYIALGYPENRARRDKAIPQGNALKNRVRKIATELGYGEEVVRIFDWEGEIQNNSEYLEEYKKVSELYAKNSHFHEVANTTTLAVLKFSEKNIVDMNKATSVAVHYLLSEIAFLEFAPKYLGVSKVSYVYHKNWAVYEDYVGGKFDGVLKPHLDFLLLENPYETYNPIWGLEEGEGEYKDTLDRIEKTKVLRVGFLQSIPTFMYDRDYNNFSGIFYEIIILIARKHNWQVRWMEEVGYGVIGDGLNNNRFDIFGCTVWPTPERLQSATFSRSLFKSPVYPYVREGDLRSKEDLKKDENARAVITENDITDSIVSSDFPHNRKVKLPQLSSNMECAHFVADRRGDFTIIERYLGDYFNKTSKVKLVPASKEPIRVYENTFMLKQGEERFKEFMDSELAILLKDGTVDSLIEKYTGPQKVFL